MVEVVESAFAAIRGHCRPTSVAQVGGFRPPADPMTSWFGGNFVSAEGEAWPETDDGPMIPLLQARVSELPYVPESLRGVALVTTFVAQRLPLGQPELNGVGWQLRTYESLSGLARIVAPNTGVRPFPVRWSLQMDAPRWEQAWDIPDMKEFTKRPNAILEYNAEFECSSATKVGGWPAHIQGTPYLGFPANFVLQIATEPKAYWSWGDSGNGYMYRDGEGKWWLYWDCY